jgi:hypothetical protein
MQAKLQSVKRLVRDDQLAVEHEPIQGQTARGLDYL